MYNKTRIAVSIITLIMLVIFGATFITPFKTGENLYIITVNNQTYYSNWYTIDTVADRVTFETTFGQTTSAPLDRTVITKY